MRVADEFSFDDTKKKLRNYIEDWENTILIL
jgi:hypothetical protein